MGILLPILLTLVALSSAALLVSTVGRRRRSAPAELPAATRHALIRTVGAELAEVMAQTRKLRGQLEAVAANGRDMLTVEDAMAGSQRRPLWRQLEDAGYEHDLDRVEQSVREWTARLEALAGSDLHVLGQLELEREPVEALTGLSWRSEPPGAHEREQLLTIQTRFEEGIAALSEFEHSIAAYRRSGYR